MAILCHVKNRCGQTDLLRHFFCGEHDLFITLPQPQPPINSLQCIQNTLLKMKENSAFWCILRFVLHRRYMTVKLYRLTLFFALFCHTKPVGAAAKPRRIEAAARSSRKAAVQAWPRRSPHQEDLKLIKYVSDHHVP